MGDAVIGAWSQAMGCSQLASAMGLGRQGACVARRKGMNNIIAAGPSTENPYDVLQATQ